MNIITYPYDSADYLDTDEAIAFYAEEVLAESDPELVRNAVNVVVRAQGLRVLAEMTGLPRQALVDALRTDALHVDDTLIAALSAISRRPQFAPARAKVGRK